MTPASPPSTSRSVPEMKDAARASLTPGQCFSPAIGHQPVFGDWVGVLRSRLPVTDRCAQLRNEIRRQGLLQYRLDFNSGLIQMRSQ
ncbi:MAG: hypothetical protein JWQ90_5539 [Hydrocarboniphaga sp.]|nr:hypothetical protein [Hydrocarboniphaga sp.]MDB5973089.1 hypothetical protein [Hydrocarboniphaga sp.]